MNNIGKYCLGGFALAIVGFLCWYFSSIIAYFVIAVIISYTRRFASCDSSDLYLGGIHPFLLYGDPVSEPRISVVE